MSTPAQKEIDQFLIQKFGTGVLDQTEEERKRLYSFFMAVSYLAENKLNLEFNQP